MDFSSRRAVLLDLDGTLVDSAADIAAALDALMRDGGLEPFASGEVRAMIGDGAGELVRRAHAARRAPLPADALDRFKAHYDACCLDTTACYPGMDGLVRDLAAAGRLVAIVTNKPTGFSETIVRAVGVAPFVAAVVGPERVRDRKPSPLHVLDALGLLGADPADAVMVGDGPTDVASGRDAGAATIAVTWGYRPRAELAAERPDAFASTVHELRALLLPASSR
jgi:phosphoglycolate phosphatase